MTLKLEVNNDKSTTDQFLALTALNKVSIPTLIECTYMALASMVEQMMDDDKYDDIVMTVYQAYIEVQEASLAYKKIQGTQIKLVSEKDRK